MHVGATREIYVTTLLSRLNEFSNTHFLSGRFLSVNRNIHHHLESWEENLGGVEMSQSNYLDERSEGISLGMLDNDS
jgi:hypothetical protein